MIVDALATVTQWHADEGWGRVAAASSGDDVWVHFAAIEGRAFGALRVGEQVRVSYRSGSRPGELEAVRVVPLADVDPRAPAPLPPGAAYRSTLTIVDDEE